MRQLSAMGSPWISSKDEVEVVVLKVVVVSSQVMGLVLLHGMGWWVLAVVAVRCGARGWPMHMVVSVGDIMEAHCYGIDDS